MNIIILSFLFPVQWLPSRAWPALTEIKRLRIRFVRQESREFSTIVFYAHQIIIYNNNKQARALSMGYLGPCPPPPPPLFLEILNKILVNAASLEYCKSSLASGAPRRPRLFFQDVGGTQKILYPHNGYSMRFCIGVYWTDVYVTNQTVSQWW